jgi:hypothetical protein
MGFEIEIKNNIYCFYNLIIIITNKVVNIFSKNL